MYRGRPTVLCTLLSIEHIMQRTLFESGLKRTNTTSNQTNNPPKRSCLPSPSQHVEAGNKESKGRTARLSTVKKWNCDWLDYEEEDGIVSKIWCRVCRKFPDIAKSRQHDGQRQLVDCDAYIVGTNNVKISAARDHEKSEGHVAASRAAFAKENPEETPIYKSVRVLQQDDNDKMCKIFNTAYYLCKEERPFHEFPNLIKFQSRQGIVLGETYRNDIACRKFAESIADVFVLDLKKRLGAKQPGSYVSIMFDGTSDKSLSERECICVKYMENGIPTTKFIG